MANRVDIVVRARDAASAAFARLDRVGGRAFSSIAGKARSMATAVAGVVPKIAAVGSAAITALPYLIKAGTAVFEFGKAAVGAAPALAAFAVAGIVVVSTLKAIFKEGSAAREALKPLADGLTKAGENASAATAKGIKPFVAAFNAKFWPEINHTMVRIGTSVGVIIGRFMEWGASAEGLRSINGILHPIWQAVENLQEPLLQVGIAFAQMLGRIMGVSLAAGQSGLTDILYKLAAAMDKVDAEGVSASLSKLKSDLTSVWNAITTAIGWIKTLIGWYKTYVTEFGYVADALALVAIAFGGPVTALIAAVGLIIRHFDDLKLAYQTVVDYFTKAPEGIGFIDNLKTAVETVLPVIKTQITGFVDTVRPALAKVGEVITTQLIPALGAFLAAAAPVAAWFLNIFGPWIANTFKNLLTVIQGIITTIAGIFKFFTAVLTGDWSAAASAIKQIASGLWTALTGIFNQIVNNAGAIFRTIGGVISAAINTAIGAAADAARAVGRAIASAWESFINGAASIGGRIVNALIGAIRGAAGRVRDAVTGLIPGPLRGAVGAIAGLFAHGGVVGGNRIGKAATGGARGGLTMVGERGAELIRLPYGSSVRSNEDSRSILQRAGGGQGRGPIQLEIRAGSSQIDKLLLEILRGAVRVRGGNVQVVIGS